MKCQALIYVLYQTINMKYEDLFSLKNTHVFKTIFQGNVCCSCDKRFKGYIRFPFIIIHRLKTEIQMIIRVRFRSCTTSSRPVPSRPPSQPEPYRKILFSPTVLMRFLCSNFFHVKTSLSINISFCCHSPFLVSCILRYRGVQLILAYSWARPAILEADKGRGEMFLFFLFFPPFHSFSFLPCLSHSSSLLSLLSFLPFTKRNQSINLSSPFLSVTTRNNPQGLMFR